MCKVSQHGRSRERSCAEFCGYVLSLSTRSCMHGCIIYIYIYIYIYWTQKFTACNGGVVDVSTDLGFL